MHKQGYKRKQGTYCNVPRHTDGSKLDMEKKNIDSCHQMTEEAGSQKLRVTTKDLWQDSVYSMSHTKYKVWLQKNSRKIRLESPNGCGIILSGLFY